MCLYLLEWKKYEETFAVCPLFSLLCIWFRIFYKSRCTLDPGPAGSPGDKPSISSAKVSSVLRLWPSLSQPFESSEDTTTHSSVRGELACVDPVHRDTQESPRKHWKSFMVPATCRARLPVQCCAGRKIKSPAQVRFPLEEETGKKLVSLGQNY